MTSSPPRTIRGVLAGLAGVFWLSAALPASAEPAVWTVKDRDSTILLFGSVHMLPAGLDWRPDELDAALVRADDLWFETPTDPAGSGEARLLARQHGTMAAGENLSALLTPEGRRRLDRICGRLGLPSSAFDDLKPWLADISLSLAVLGSQGVTIASGVEQSLSTAVPGVPRRYFESPGEQILMFAQTPVADQLASLEDTLRQLDEDPEMFDRLVRAWLKGDQGQIRDLGVEPLKAISPTLYSRILIERNRRWAKEIERRLAGSGRTVIVVGAAHLTGPDGVPALLRARGIEVEGP